jgi:hypothetical protein
MARDHLDEALSLARKLPARSLILQATALRALIDEVHGDKAGSEKYAVEWQSAMEEDSKKLEIYREEVRRVSSVVTDVGRSVASGWR